MTIGLRRALILCAWAMAFGGSDALALPAATSAATTPVPGTCDPSVATCIKVCSPLEQAQGRCRPSNGGGGGGSGGGTCSPSPNGNPSCGGGGPASQGGGAGGGVQLGGGNPINLVTGNKHQEETDLQALPGVLGLELKRYYNSQGSQGGLLGANWRMSYETVLYDLGGQIQVVQADGRRLTFQRGPGEDNTTLCSSAYPQDGQVRIETEAHGVGGRVYRWRWPDGRTLAFAGGSGGGHPLVSITAGTGEQVTLSHGPDGELTHVRDPQGRKLVFIYANRSQKRSRALEAIDTPLGRIRYSHDGLGRLVEVSSFGRDAPAPYLTRLYHYEDQHNGGHPHALTGVSIRGMAAPSAIGGQAVRLSTFVYNRAGQAILSTRGRLKVVTNGKVEADTGIDQIELEFVAKPLPFEGKAERVSGEVRPRHLGKTVLTNSLGQKTDIEGAVIGGHFRLVQMRGAGCSTCGPTDVQYGYNSRGQLLRATLLDARGHPMRSSLIEYDMHGRVSRRGELHHGRKTGETPHRQILWTHRYEYRDVRHADGSIGLAPWPSLIAQPSVAAGLEHVVQVDAGSNGEPLSWTEQGFSPLDPVGDPGVPSPIAKTTRFRYATVAGHRVLAEIDGPLPNGPLDGPEDSDITRLHWDAGGRFIVAITHPMNLRTEVQRDPSTGLVLSVTGPDGFTDTYQRDSAGLPSSVKQTRGEVLIAETTYRRDALGRVVETADRVGSSSAPRIRQAFDVAGRSAWQVDHLGILRHAAHDTEGHLLRSTVQTSRMRQEERYEHNDRGQLRRIDDNTGAVRDLLWDDGGHVMAAVDPLGRSTRYRYDDARRLRQVIRGIESGQPLQLDLDYDAHGRLEQVTAVGSDGKGGQRDTSTRVRHDDFGRPVMVTRSDAAAVIQEYDEADRLHRIRDASGRTVTFDHDAAGRVTRRTIASAVAGASDHDPASTPDEPAVTRYTYEGTRLVEVTDREQSELYAYDERGRVATRDLRLLLASGASVLSQTRYRHDDEGRLIARSLPDGSELRYERNGQGQVVGLSRQTESWAPFGWGRQDIVTALQRDLIGLSSATFGNGIEGQWQRSREGVLARIVYTRPGDRHPRLRAGLDDLVPAAQAATGQAVSSRDAPRPGAFALPADPRALWDSRLLFDANGNVVVQAQFAASDVTQPQRNDYAYDALDQLAQARRGPMPPTGPAAPVASADASTSVWRYLHDSLGNRLLAQERQPFVELAQTATLRYASEHTARRVDQTTDDRGHVLQSGRQRYVWNAAGQLTALHAGGVELAHYRYDHRGLRIAKHTGGSAEHYLYDEQRHRLAELDAKGRLKREYLWLGDQLVAVIDLGEPRVPHAAAQTLPQRLGRLIASIWQLCLGRGDRLMFVHVDHLGAPVAMTDRSGKPVWAMDHAPFGEHLAPAPATAVVQTGAGSSQRTGERVPPAVKLDLRLPGQWEDEESGLHYNDHRYYDPRQGRYLSPDPLGLRAGVNAYSYVGNNPVGHADPLGLILFAFDGTGNNSKLDSRSRDFTNIWWMHQYYDQSVEGQAQAFYQIGIGTDPTWSGAVNAYQMAVASIGHDYVDAQIRNLDRYMASLQDPMEAIVLDVIGFSRGAAEARDFSNRVISRYAAGGYEKHCLEFRFMGLFDTVSQFGLGGANDNEYDFTIAPQWRSVAHAYALNEHRALFPLRPINRGVERGFVGAHSDVGGGYNNGSQRFPGDLSDAALTWMVAQAEAAGVKFRPLPDELKRIDNPVVHDQRNTSVVYGTRYERVIVDPTTGAMVTTLPPDERSVILPSGRRTSQPDFAYVDPAYGAMMEALIQRPTGWEYRTDNCAGQADMSQYGAWLQQNYGVRMTASPLERINTPCGQARPR
ncbi:MAG TPA: DUF2235 domain-containing protein [Albitalea sp.]|uniref:phospholipase effector Tle1 domain-containing protein n=1 Tax=Piscinibacter sp. TaxID=1903157 RepID=UPI002ED12F16